MRTLIPALASLLIVGFAAASDAQGLKLDNVRLLVNHFDETFVFYRDALGLTPTWGGVGQNYASFGFPGGGGQLALFKRELMADAIGVAHSGDGSPGESVALVLAVEDVDAAVARLKAKGVVFVAPPESRETWGIRAAHFRDPDGNLLEIYSPLAK